MKNRLCQLLSLLLAMEVWLWPTVAAPQSQPQASPQAPAAAALPAQPVTPPASGQFVLEDGTPVKLRIGETVSSESAHVGDTVDFEVLEEVKVSGILVIPKGGIAWATVTVAQPKRRMGRGGKLDMNIDSVRLLTGDKAALRAVQGGSGGGHVGAMTGAIVATSLVFFPAAPFFLFMHGKEITIPKGTEITAFVNGNNPLDAAKFLEKAAPPPVAHAADTPASQPAAEEQLEINSTPPGADIEIDGTFVGNTPSTVSVAPGEHVITIKKSGYNPFEKKMKTSTGKVTIAAELEIVPKTR